MAMGSGHRTCEFVAAILFVSQLLSCSSTTTLIDDGVSASDSSSTSSEVTSLEIRTVDAAGAEEATCLSALLGQGCACVANEDCASGWCIYHLGERICTSPCDPGCPEHFECQPIAGSGTDEIHLCVSSFPSLCLPCMSDEDCPGSGDLCVPYDPPGDGTFCGATCGGDTDCPKGYRCTNEAGREEAGQCVLAEGECTCTFHAISAGLGTRCASSGEWGSCPGYRVCTEGGLTPCDAAPAEQESCDGSDNDCDGETDEEFECADDNFCTKDLCQAGDCVHEPLSGIDCADDDACTTKEHCVEGVCLGDQIDCADDNPCTDDSCEPATGCKHVANGATCDDDGDPCTADVCQDSGCTHPPGNDEASCDDGDFCTVGDTCADGQCVPGAVKEECVVNCGDVCRERS